MNPPLQITIILLIAINCISCQDSINKTPNKPEKTYPNLVKNFELDLDKLDRTKIASIDSATTLFKKYRIKTKDIKQIDSLFQPYFSLYNIGRQLLVGTPDSLVNKYGFSRLISEEREFILPTECEYLNSNIIKYLSEPMKAFTTQQLKEFGPKTIQLKADFTIWWEIFNQKNPAFFLNEMAEYHYKYWHLKRLVKATFNKEGELKEETIVEYNRLITNYPKSKTSKTLKEYLIIIEESKNKKTASIDEFWEQFESE